MCDAGAGPQEKAEYLSQWDYGIDNEYDDAIISREELIELVSLPFSGSYVVETANGTYLLAEQIATSVALFRAIS